ncbi:hypothetical protein WN944_029671 [Citrus x changshan-huyou]|uniref:CCHC-type domain-containing protein n=1 Tax=Citrus x changshan-huyou TaxID=2935761 RepID=A0AAP0LGI0_9ROSI
MDRNEILATLHNQFPSLPQNALLTIYEARSEHMRLLMRNNITADIRWLIEAKVEDKIQFIRDGLNKESFDDILSSLETHHSGYVQGEILQGGNRRLLKLISEAALVRGSQVLGIIPRVLKPLGSLSDSPTGEELVIPGDLATLEALITLASWAHLNIHQKLIALLNVNNFYDGFIAFLNHAIKNYFIPSTVKKVFICAHTANELLDLLQAYRPEPYPRTLVLECLNNDGTILLIGAKIELQDDGHHGNWFDSLGQYRQLQFVDLPEVSSALAVLHDQFLGDPSAVFEAARRDYLNMKCCSLNAKDLDFHYKEFKRKQSSRCFICKRKGHYAKDCPNKREKFILLVEHLQATTDYSPAKDELEFYFSEQDEPNDETVIALQNSSDSDSDQSQVIFHQQLLSLDTTVPIPSIKLQILPSKFQRPIPAIGLIDIGAQRSMLNPHILPSEYWTQFEEHFKAVNGKLFTTSLITKKPIGIQIFPNCVIWTKVIGSTLPNKDILLGFDILHQIKHLQIIPTGIRVKSMFKPFTDILKLYNLSETPQSYQDISTKLLRFCPESHSEFTHPNPLWKNKSFFIKLPFKLNEDINPTKATHPGMSPSDLLLAQQECSQLLAQGLIEPTSSHDEHRQLLTQFYDIIQSHGIMLSAKKSTIATNNIEFLGMVIKDGHYQPGKHIAQELLHFPDQQLSKRQIQQFLGIINYIRDFIPYVDHYTHHLSALLKKKPPEWNADHTIAVTTLKQIAQNPPPLKLITDGKRILQTDASDKSWGAILLEELNHKEHFIAYASGQFSDTQKHYHSVFKEILAVKNGIKKFEYHLIGHHFLIRMDSSAFPNIFHFKGKTVPEKMLLRLKDWFSKYDFSVKHIKGSQNLIPDMLSRLSKPQNPLTLFSTTYHFPIISMATSLPPEALTKKTFPFNKTFSSVFAIQEFARKALFRFFMKAYLVTDPFPFSTFHPENLFLTGLTLDPTRDTTEDVLWYIWCLTVLYATKLVLPISPTLDHLLNPENATSLTWTLLEWFSLIPWWRKNCNNCPKFTTLTVYEWFTAPHIAVIENDIQDVLHNYLCQLNHQPPPLKDISHTSLGPQHDILMIPTPSAISKPKSTGIIIKEERPDYTDFLYQDSQDPWEDFLPLSQHLHQLPQPTMDEPGPSEPGSSSQPSKADKATQMPSPKSQPSPSKPGYRRDCPYPPCRGPNCKHPNLSKTFFPKSNPDNPYETESSFEDDYINLRSP